MVEIRTIVLEMLVLNSIKVVMVLTSMTGIFMMEVTRTMAGLITTTMVVSRIKAIGVETRTTPTTGTTRISTMVATMIIMMDSGIKAMEINTAEIQMVD